MYIRVTYCPCATPKIISTQFGPEFSTYPTNTLYSILSVKITFPTCSLLASATETKAMFSLAFVSVCIRYHYSFNAFTEL